jgi:hypothetical protein
MQKRIRRATQSPARSVTHKPPRGSPTKRALQPRVMRLDSDVELIAPPGYRASVLLKLVDRDDGHRYYSWWAMAGRHDMDKVAVPYKYTGEDTIRFDLPEGMPLSAEALEPHLVAYLASEGLEPSDPPVIR